MVKSDKSPTLEPVTPNFEITPDGIRVGTMSDAEFCRWIRTSSLAVQLSIVRHFTWWTNKKTFLRHEFVVLTIEHKPGGSHSSEACLYDIRVERIGKTVGLRRTAEHRVTISPHQSFEDLLADNVLKFGMYDARGGLDVVTTPEPVTPLEPPQKERYGYSRRAFQDVLDQKWRGHPALLWQVSRYVEAIMELFPRYNLGTTNCYYFSRSLTYVVGLRHYSFSTLISSDRRALKAGGKLPNPSGIGILFRYLGREQEWNLTRSLEQIFGGFAHLVSGTVFALITILEVLIHIAPNHPRLSLHVAIALTFLSSALGVWTTSMIVGNILYMWIFRKHSKEQMEVLVTRLGMPWFIGLDIDDTDCSPLSCLAIQMMTQS